MRIGLALIPALFLATGTARADGFLESGSQLPTLVSLSWEGVVPQGPMRGFVDQTAWRGGELQIATGVARHLSLGMCASWNWVAQAFPSGSFQFPDATITGAAYRRVQLVGLRATLQWYLTGGPVQPWLGAGLGGGWHQSYLAVADVVRTGSAWHAAAEPRAGLLWTVSRGLAVNLQARYVFTTARIGDARDARWLAVDLGLAVY
jgi:hypothetical protein